MALILSPAHEAARQEAARRSAAAARERARQQAQNTHSSSSSSANGSSSSNTSQQDFHVRDIRTYPHKHLLKYNRSVRTGIQDYDMYYRWKTRDDFEQEFHENSDNYETYTAQGCQLQFVKTVSERQGYNSYQDVRYYKLRKADIETFLSQIRGLR